MANDMMVKELDQVVVRFSGDSGDGMQLAGNIFSTVSATVGNDISTFPDYPADIRAPQGSLTGVSGFQVHIGASKVFTPGDKCDVLVAMNAAALKTQYKFAKSTACIIIDTDCFQASDLQKAAFKTDNPIEEMGIKQDVIAAPISQMVKDCLAETGMDNKAMLKCRNMFALGLVCWLFNRDLKIAEDFLREKFAKKPEIAEANIKVIHAGYDYGHNTHASVAHTYKIESKIKTPGIYGSGSWKLPNLDTYPEIKPQYVTPEMKDNYTPYKRNPENQVRYWAIPGQEGYTHILGGLEKDSNTGAISTDPENHNLMCHLRAEKVAKIAVPDVEVQGCADDADLLIVGFGGTYGHLYSAMEEMNKAGQKVALAHFSYINPLPKNTAEVLKKYKKVVVAEQNLGQFAGYLRMKVDNFTPYQFNEVKGQPFVVSELVAAFTEILKK